MGTLGISRLITAVLPHLTGLRVQAVTMAEDGRPSLRLTCRKVGYGITHRSQYHSLPGLFSPGRGRAVDR
jgi:hypothetical protein